MRKQTTAADEFDRAATLAHYRVADVGPETDFDDLTKIAAHICETPVALITIIESSRQWFKSKFGTELSGTPRDIAFCAHTILQKAPLIVEDMLTDDRFKENPLVTGVQNVRFYAGVPLIMPNGQCFGTICVLDRKPRKLSESQLSTLCSLARQVVSQLELRLHLRLESEAKERAAKSELKFRQVFDNAPMGLIQFNSKIEFVEANPAFCEWLEYSQGELLGRNVLEITHPDDIELTRRERSKFPKPSHDRYTFQKRYVTKSGKTVWGKITSSLIPSRKLAISRSSRQSKTSRN